MSMKFAVLLLTADCEQAALVKPNSRNDWTLPLGSCNGEPSTDLVSQVAEVATGVCVRDRIQPDFLQGVGASGGLRVYVAICVPNVQLLPSKVNKEVEAATWRNTSTLFEPGNFGGLPKDSPLRVVGTQLHDWLAKHPQAKSPNNTDTVLAEALNYRSDTWNGTPPKEHLLRYCQLNQLPCPSFTVFEYMKGMRLFCSTCILPHLGLQLTPGRGFAQSEEAIQNAALFAILFLENALDPSSGHCQIARVGRRAVPPPSRVVMHSADAGRVLEETNLRLQREKERLVRDFEQKQARLEQLQSQLQSHKDRIGSDPSSQLATQIALTSAYNGAPAAAAGARPFKRQRSGPSAQDKNPIQAIKELCDKQKWPQAEYNISKDLTHNTHVCRITIPSAGVFNVAGTSCSNQKDAKTSAAQNVVLQLTIKGLL